jgi:hypothetical protein
MAVRTPARAPRKVFPMMHSNNVAFFMFIVASGVAVVAFATVLVLVNP